MGDLIEVSAGMPPWQPASDAEIYETYHFWDTPRAGIIRQHGALFAFLCVDGHSTDRSTWAYSHVTPVEVLGIEGSGDPVAGVLTHLVNSHHVMVAFAEAPRGIMSFEEREGGLDVSELALAIE